MIKARTYDVLLNFRGEDTRNGSANHLYKDLLLKKIEIFIDDEELRRGDEISRALSSFSSSSSSSSSTAAAAADMIKARTYDVFLSFRGKDTRDSFVSHLYKDLCRKNIETFIDDEELRKGDEISGALLTAIQGSRVSVIVFSKDYASSKWCLAELVKIMDCNKWVVPVFYSVDPRDVRHQTGSFAEAFAKHEENFKHELEKVKTWRSALTAAGKLSGWDSQVSRPDSTLVDKIVEDVVKKLSCGTSSANLKGLVGIERRMQEVLSLFQYGFPDFRMLGIWGMGGIGKTTLADAIYHHVSNGFQSCCFLANVREHEEQRELLKLRKEFLSTILEDENLYISTPTIGSGFLKDRLSKKEVLIVCDDMSKLSQLEFLFGGINRFGPGSRVIVTTRDKQVLIQCGIDLIYEVEELDGDESVQLFCQRAFKSSHPIEYQLELSKMVLGVAKGNPLAIRLIGSSLCGKTKSYQESEVKKLKQVPKQDIQNVLKWSFDGLDCEEKEMFLDIACFFKGKDRDHVTRVMDACYVSAHSGIENLIDKSLISVSHNWIAMHDLLQQMGWNIVHNVSPFKPEKRSRLWIPKDSYDTSGYKISIRKSSIFFSKTTFGDVRNQIIQLFGFQKLQNLGKYLGVPLLHEKISKNTLSFIVDKVRQKLQSWDARRLSMARRITLAQSVLLSIPNFFMQSLMILKGVCLEIEKLVRHFIWGRIDDHPKMSLIGWDTICEPRARGGLSLRLLKDQNKSFLMKIGFSLISKSDAFWVRVLRSKIPSSTNLDLDCRVRDFVNSDGCWNLDLFPVWLLDEVINKVISIPPPHPDFGPDRVTWARSSSGALSIRSAYWTLKEPIWNHPNDL
ncbi:hypothetical protein J1N35_023650 [Gossypium stocksii]|uniref:TIR domain-containing protein n=1 Tax=Gossypium stocksii TaxID=47602 RepID=A0A9D4A4L4_9ROSI|nr:hypothetical protein J1N35_023650 [Gossypium stocksii]